MGEHALAAYLCSMLTTLHELMSKSSGAQTTAMLNHCQSDFFYTLDSVSSALASCERVRAYGDRFTHFNSRIHAQDAAMQI